MGHSNFAARRTLGILVLLLLAGFLPAQTTGKPPRLTRDQVQLLQQAQRKGEQAGKYLSQNKLPEAVAAWKKKLALERRVWGGYHPQIVQSLQVLVRMCEDNDDYAGAAAALQDLQTIQTKRLGKSNWQVAELQRDLDDVRAMAKLPADARRQLREARQLNQKVLQLYSQGKANTALPLAQRVVALRKEVLGEQHLDYAKALNNLATLYKDLGDYPKALALYEQARGITGRILGTGHPTYASCLNNLALLHQDMGEYAKAEALFLQAIEIKRTVLGEKHPDYAQSLNNLAGMYWSRGDYDKAEPLFEKALLISKQAYGETSPLYAAALGKLALVYQETGAYAKAEPLLQKALTIRRQSLGDKNPEYLESLNSLAWLHFHMAAYDRAEPLFEKASRLTKEAMGDRHPDYAATLNTLAWLYEAQGKYSKAEPLLDKASTIYRKALGSRHPDYADNLNRLAWVRAANGHFSKAEDAYDDARKSYHDHALRILPALAEAEQLTFLREEIQVGLYEAVSLALDRPKDYDLRVRSAGWHLNGKALAPAVLAEGNLLGRDSGARAKLFKDLNAVRQQLAEATFAALPPIPPPKEQEPERKIGKKPEGKPVPPPLPPEFARHLDKVSQLAQREASLARQLGRPALYPAWTELTAVRKAMPANAVLIDLARLTPADFNGRSKQARWKAARYVAYLVPAFGKGRVELIDLGEAETIDGAVQEVRQAFLSAPAEIKNNGEAEAEQQLKRKLQALSALLIGPISKHLGKYEHWIVSPESSLWLVPWAALPISDGRYALEKYQITYVVSGRDLLRGPASGVRGQGLGKPMILADPDYSEGKTQNGEKERFVEVPGSAAEARALTALLEKYAGEAPDLYAGKQARKNVLITARKPRVVVLSAQGFFRADQDECVAPLLLGHLGHNLKLTDPVLLKVDLTVRAKKIKVLENPLARCGVGLTGANHPPSRTTEEDQDDGLLTGQDVTGADLRGTDLVLLTAGIPPSGSARIGDAVGAFRQAFRSAGERRTVIDALFPVPEAERLQLLSAFFDNLGPKKTKSRALRQAQLAVIEARRAKGKAAHPLYWAAFTLTGSWQ